MKIEDRIGTRRQTETAKRVLREVQKDVSPFFKVLERKQLSSSQEEINELLRKLDAQAERLIHSRTLADLHHYKKIVSKILERTVGSSLRLHEQSGTDRYHRPRLYRCVEKINEEMAALTDHLLKRETTRLQLLEKIGHIKGLLLQLHA